MDDNKFRKYEKGHMTFHQNGFFHELQTKPIRRDGRNPLPPVIQVLDAAILALFFIVVAWLTYLILTGGQDLFSFVHFFEDGSFALGNSFPYAVSGCFPWGICMY